MYRVYSIKTEGLYMQINFNRDRLPKGKGRGTWYGRNVWFYRVSTIDDLPWEQQRYWQHKCKKDALYLTAEQGDSKSLPLKEGLRLWNITDFMGDRSQDDSWQVYRIATPDEFKKSKKTYQRGAQKP